MSLFIRSSALDLLACLLLVPCLQFTKADQDVAAHAESCVTASSMHFWLQAHKVCPSDPLACNELGVLTYRNQQYSAAEQWLLRALELVPGRLNAGWYLPSICIHMHTHTHRPLRRLYTAIPLPLARETRYHRCSFWNRLAARDCNKLVLLMFDLLFVYSCALLACTAHDSISQTFWAPNDAGHLLKKKAGRGMPL